MAQLKLTELCLTEVKQDAISDFNLTSEDNNIALLGSNAELITLELIYLPDPAGLFPYSLSYAEVPQERHCGRLFENIELQHIYSNSSVQERQELAMDPMYTAEYSYEPLKAKAVQLHFAPWQLRNGQPLLAVLTTYGACQILSRRPSSRHWQQKLDNLNKFFLSNKNFPLNKSIASMKSFSEFKRFIGQYWITAFVWHSTGCMRLIFAANAIGYIVAFKWNDELEDFSEYCTSQTEVGRISYLNAFDDFLLVGNVQGLTQIFKVDHSAQTPVLRHVETLWSNADRIPCREAEVRYAKDLNCYFVVFSKAAHVLAFRLNTAGCIVSNARLHTGGVKITGLHSLTVDEFLVSTIVGKVLRIRLSCASTEVLTLSAEDVATELDTTNFQILGLAATRNKSLWSLMLYRTKEYTNQSKYSASSAFVSVCKLSAVDSLSRLTNVRVTTMDAYLDYIVAIGLDVMNGFELQKYNAFCDLRADKMPHIIDEAFMLQLQIKLLINRKSQSFQRLKHNKVKASTVREFEFLVRAIQITHIIFRLLHLTGLSATAQLNPFQQLAANCMRAKSRLLLAELLAMINNELVFKSSMERFFSQATAALNSGNVDITSIVWTEKCLICSEATSPNTLQCSNAHTVNRCCVSYVQLPIITRRYCSVCNYYALEDNVALQQLFPPNEIVKCTLCCFLLMNDAI